MSGIREVERQEDFMHCSGRFCFVSLMIDVGKNRLQASSLCTIVVYVPIVKDVVGFHLSFHPLKRLNNLRTPSLLSITKFSGLLVAQFDGTAQNEISQLIVVN